MARLTTLLSRRDDGLLPAMDRLAGQVAEACAELHELLHHGPDRFALVDRIANEHREIRHEAQELRTSVSRTFIGSAVEAEDVVRVADALQAAAGATAGAASRMAAYELERPNGPTRELSRQLADAAAAVQAALAAVKDRGSAQNQIAEALAAVGGRDALTRQALSEAYADDPGEGRALAARQDVVGQLSAAMAWIERTAEAIELMAVKEGP